MIEAYAAVRTDMPLLIVGDAPYAHEYIAQLKSTSDTRVRLRAGFMASAIANFSRVLLFTSMPLKLAETHPGIDGSYGRRQLRDRIRHPENSEVVGGCGLLYKDVSETNPDSAIGPSTIKTEPPNIG